MVGMKDPSVLDEYNVVVITDVGKDCGPTNMS